MEEPKAIREIRELEKEVNERINQLGETFKKVTNKTLENISEILSNN